jgi:hypothetical protein
MDDTAPPSDEVTTVDSPHGPVDITRPLKSEVGRWGFTMMGSRALGLEDFGIPADDPGVGESRVDITTIGLRYWYPSIGWEAGLGLTVLSRNDTVSGDGTAAGFALQGGLLISLARYEYANVFVPIRLALTPFATGTGSDPAVTWFQLGFTGQIALELFADALDFIRTSRALSFTLGMGVGLDVIRASVEDGPAPVEFQFRTADSTDVIGSLTGSLALTYYF